MSHVILRSNELEVVVGDNEPGTGPVSSHCGGYNGIWSLKSRHAPANCFAPSYAGLNFEHCYDERFQSAVDHKELIYEPRNTPMRLVEATDSSAVLHQPPTAWTGVESWTRFQVEDNRIEFEFRAIPRKEPAGRWLGMFWASYLHAPADSGISFLGNWPEDSSPTGWMKLAADAHGVHAGATVRMLGVPMDRLEWKQSEAGLVVSPPLQDMSNGKKPNVPCDHAFVYKITPRPTWIEP